MYSIAHYELTVISTLKVHIKHMAQHIFMNSLWNLSLGTLLDSKNNKWVRRTSRSDFCRTVMDVFWQSHDYWRDDALRPCHNCCTRCSEAYIGFIFVSESASQRSASVFCGFVSNVIQRFFCAASHLSAASCRLRRFSVAVSERITRLGYVKYGV